MSASPEKVRQHPSQRPTTGSLVCPACGSSLAADAKWCGACHFTGGQTIEMFSDAPPPLVPILDAVGLWNEQDIRMIEAAREVLRRRFPQFHWCVCSVCLPADTSLPLFGFWLLNVCPLSPDETPEQRAWTVLLLIDVRSGQAAAIPGYAAEPWLSDGDWRKILIGMAPHWRLRDTAGAVVGFFQNCADFLEETWKHRGSGRRKR